MGMFILIIVVIFASIVIPIAKKIADTEDNQSERTILQMELEKYNNLKKYTLFNNDLIFLNNSSNKMTHIIIDQNNNFETYHFNYKDIIEVALIVDGNTLTSTSRGSQLGGALVGGALFGGTGAVIGGLSGEKESKQTVSQLYIKLTLLSNEKNIKNLIFLDVKNPIEKSSAKFNKLYEEAMELEGTFKVIIYQNDKKNFDKLNTNSASIADEIKKLHNLLTDGILTEEEFVLQKERILSK